MKIIDRIKGRDPYGPTGKTFRRARKVALFVADYNQSFNINTVKRSVVLTRGGVSETSGHHTLVVAEDHYNVSHSGQAPDGTASSKVHTDAWEAVYDFMGGDTPDDLGGWA